MSFFGYAGFLVSKKCKKNETKGAFVFVGSLWLFHSILPPFGHFYHFCLIFHSFFCLYYNGPADLLCATSLLVGLINYTGLRPIWYDLLHNLDLDSNVLRRIYKSRVLK